MLVPSLYLKKRMGFEIIGKVSDIEIIAVNLSIREDMNNSSDQRQFVICIADQNYDDLQVLKIYQCLPDEKAEEESYIRVIDDSGEDYLYPAKYFIETHFPDSVTKQLIAAIPSAA